MLLLNVLSLRVFAAKPSGLKWITPEGSSWGQVDPNSFSLEVERDSFPSTAPVFLEHRVDCLDGSAPWSVLPGTLSAESGPVLHHHRHNPYAKSNDRNGPAYTLSGCGRAELCSLRSGLLNLRAHSMNLADQVKLARIEYSVGDSGVCLFLPFRSRLRRDLNSQSGSGR
jgi:hypothetical protein